MTGFEKKTFFRLFLVGMFGQKKEFDFVKAMVFTQSRNIGQQSWWSDVQANIAAKTSDCIKQGFC